MSKFREIFRGRPKYVTVRADSQPEQTAKREVPDGLWQKCTGCGIALYTKELARNLHVCDKCGFHFRIGADERLAQILDDPAQFEVFDAELLSRDVLKFPGYVEKMETAYEKVGGRRDAVITGRGAIHEVDVVVAAMDFFFMGGSMGSVVGEKVTRAFERATEAGLPIVTFAASGGARMQEGIFSLMQMQKTVAAVERHSRAGLLFISVLTDPTTAGVFGSFASQGDINIAEPAATIGFAGERVIQETIRRPVPPNLQKAETVLANGFIDMIVPRPQLKGVLGRLLQMHVQEGWYSARHREKAAGPMALSATRAQQ